MTVQTKSQIEQLPGEQPIPLSVLEDNGFVARSFVEKARARRLIAKGQAQIENRTLETRIINGRLYTYEAWDVQLIPAGAK